MGVYIDAQDKYDNLSLCDLSILTSLPRMLSDMLAQYRGSKSRTSLEAASTSSHGDDESAPPVLVLPSSTELFYFYAQTLDQCAKLFTGQPLYDLRALFKKWLRIYAGSSLVRLIVTAPNSRVFPRGSTRCESQKVHMT